MPHTYPRPAQQAGPSNHIPSRPTLSPNHSRYLSSNQHNRIMSWRSHTSASTVGAKAKSAPSSLDLSVGESASPCATCATQSVCSCSTRTKRQKSYYSSKRKKSTTATMTSVTPVTPVTPRTPGPDQNSHVVAAASQAPPMQYGPIPVRPLPDPKLAMPPPKVELPRIAGTRDPISQN